jgi:hypothetical protein
MRIKYLLLTILLIVLRTYSFAQYVQPMNYGHYSFPYQVNIGYGSLHVTHAGSYLELGPDSTATKGIRIPRGNKTSVTSPGRGLLYYNLSDSTLVLHTGYQWLNIFTQQGGDARYPQLSGSYANPSWISSLAYSKITGGPTAGYGLGQTGTVLSVDTSKIGLKEWRFDVAKHGGDTSGTTDVSALVQSAINSGQKVIYFPKGKYLFSSTVQLKDSVTIIGDGRENSIIKLTTNITAFTLSHTLGGYGCQFRDFGFLGNINHGETLYSPRYAANDSFIAATTAQRGIYADTVTGVMVHNVGSKRIGGFVVTFKAGGVLSAPNQGGYTTGGTRGNQVLNCFFADSWGGVLFDASSEYSNVTACHITNGRYGVYDTAAGNNQIIGNNLSNNLYGLYVAGGGNDGHGIASGNTMNHCDTSVLISGLSRGFLLVGNYFLVGITKVKNSDRVLFSSNTGRDAIIVENCTNTVFNNQSWWQGAAPTWIITGESPTVIYLGTAKNTLSLVDPKNNQELDIKHYNGHANISSRFVGIGVDSVSSWVGFYVNKTIGLNKDSLPITTGKTWQLVIDTTTGQVMRQLVSPTDTSGLSSRIDAKADKTANINAQTGTTYTLLSSDNGKVLTFNNASAITLTVPTGLGAGFNCLVVQIGAGQVTFSASSTTINNRSGYTKTAGQYATATIAAYAANTFVTGGDMQ